LPQWKAQGIALNITAHAVAASLDGLTSEAPVWFDSTSGVVSVNTQARRLGCLVYILGQVAHGRKIESLLVSLSARELDHLKQNLSEYGLVSGYLTPKQSSVKHYLDAAVELHLLVRQGAVFSLTTRGQFLIEAIRPNVSSPYPLKLPAKVFFLYTLLANDYFGTAAIARSLLAGAKRLAAVQREHHSQLLRLLAEAGLRSANTRLSRVVQDRIISIRNWKQPQSYAEHLVSAKLNWLADLGVLQLASTATSDISIIPEHRPWLQELSTSTSPTDAQVIALTLNYSLATYVDEHSLAKVETCALLGNAFQRLSTGGGLEKVRCNDFLLLALCEHPPMLARLIEDGKPLLPNSAVACGNYVYKPHFASRPTQSFIVRQTTLEA
jgi:hypothetical protein